MRFELDGQKRQSIIREFGNAGRDWADRYPALLQRCVERWDLSILDVAEAGLAVNSVLFAETKDRKPVVLKIGYPQPEQVTEMIALAAYDHHQVVKLLDSDPADGALLLERILPGTPFRSSVQDDSRSRVRIPLFTALPVQTCRPDGLPGFSDWLRLAFTTYRRSADRGDEFLAFIDRAETSYDRLRDRYGEDCLLHGDLHHENILQDTDRGWMAIDPKGVIGPPVMECGRYLHNFIEDEIEGVVRLEEATDQQIEAVFHVRFDTFETMLDFSRQEIVSAAFIDLVLTSCWSLNQGEAVDFRRIRILTGLLDSL